MKEILKEMNALIESRATLKNSYSMNLRSIEEMQIDLLVKMLADGDIKLTKKDITKMRLLFNLNGKEYIFTGITNSIRDNKTFYLYAIPTDEFNAVGDLDNFLWDSFKTKIDIGHKDNEFVCCLINYLIENNFIHETKEFNINVTTICHLKARSLEEAIEMAYRTSTYDENGNDITASVIAADKANILPY